MMKVGGTQTGTRDEQQETGAIFLKQKVVTTLGEWGERHLVIEVILDLN